MTELELLKKQVELLEQLVTAQKQTIETLQYKTPTIQYVPWYQPYQQPYYQAPYWTYAVKSGAAMTGIFNYQQNANNANYGGTIQGAM